jgi:thymidylate kinase
MRYVVVEGLPAVGKSEILALLSCFYPQRVRVLPELVKEVATREGLDLFSQRERLTEAILAEIPRRRAEIEEALDQGKLCLEESHVGVHLAYSEALEDRSFTSVYPRIENLLPAIGRPD